MEFIQKSTHILSKTLGDTIEEYLFFRPTSREKLDEAIDLWFENKDEAIEKYGIIGTWNISLITDMSKLFYDREDFNEDISDWDVSNVTNMSKMFNACYEFNQPLNNWDVRNVTDMDFMFRDCEKLTNLPHWYKQ